MNEEHIAASATPHDQLMAELMDCRVSKTEREHAAAREITRLRAIVARVEDVEEGAKAMCIHWGRPCPNCLRSAIKVRDYVMGGK